MVALSSAAALLHSRRGAAARGRRRLQPLRCALADVTPDGSGSGSVFDAPAAAAMRDEKSGDLVAWSDWADGVPAAPLPPPLTLQQRLSRSAQFWSVLFPLLARYTFWTTQLAIPALAALYTPKQKADVWNALHEQGSTELSAVITKLGGFFVKSGQLIGGRPDLFPPPYTKKLRPLQDELSPMDGALIVRLVEDELKSPLSAVFSEFDAAPLGSASVAQVHRARLKSTGKVVAVKVQRPGMEALMDGDVANLLLLADNTRGRFPVDYSIVFSELQAQLKGEFDFVREAESMTRIHALLAALPGGPPLRVPLPVPGYVTKRVLVMDYCKGTPLSRLAAEVEAKGAPGGAMGTIAARMVAVKLLRALTDAYGAMLLGAGFFHGDPHPGNILLSPSAEISLVDFGQTKQLPDATRLKLARIMLLLDARGRDVDAGRTPNDAPLSAAALDLGVTFKPSTPSVDDAAAALALWLFDSTAGSGPLPGGYDASELSSTSPVAEVASFPQELVFVGRATVLMRGLAARLGVPWSLAREWAPAARRALEPPGSVAVEPRRAVWWRRAAGALVAMLAAALRAITAAFAPAFKTMRYTRPSEGCAFTP